MNNNQDDGSAKDGDGDTKKIQGGKKERKIKKKKPKKSPRKAIREGNPSVYPGGANEIHPP